MKGALLINPNMTDKDLMVMGDQKRDAAAKAKAAADKAAADEAAAR
jgi:hypothetical protein